MWDKMFNYVNTREYAVTPTIERHPILLRIEQVADDRGSILSYHINFRGLFSLLSRGYLGPEGEAAHSLTYNTNVNYAWSLLEYPPHIFRMC